MAFFQTFEAWNAVNAGSYLTAATTANVTSVIRSATGYTVTYTNGTNLYVYGTNLTYATDLTPIGGTITGFSFYVTGQQVYAASGMSLDVGAVAGSPGGTYYWATEYANAAKVVAYNYGDYLDTLQMAGDDNYTGSTGNDSFYSGGGNDYLVGAAGADNLNGEGGDDWIEGGDGNDTVTGGDNSAYGRDILFGGNGDDFVSGGNGVDALYGGAGADTLQGGAGVDWIEGGDGNDYIYADGSFTTGQSSIYQEVLIGGNGGDTIYGYGSVALVALGGDGADYVYGSDLGDWVEGGIGDTSNDNVYGFLGADTVIGGGGVDNLYGGDGADILITGGGTAYMEGGLGADTLWGGNGNDTFVGGEGADLLLGLGGNDTFRFSARADLSAGVRDTIRGFARLTGDFDNIALPSGYGTQTSYQQIGADTLISVAMTSGGYAEILVENAQLIAVQSAVTFTVF
jgi:Ca2+-binding RTX toxin-like protein